MRSQITTEISKIKNLSSDQFEALYRITQALNSAEYQDNLIEEVLDFIIKTLNAERGLFVKYNGVEEDFSIVAARNVENENITDLAEFSSGILHKVIFEKKPLLHHDIQGDPQLSQYESVQLQNIKSVIGVPVLRDQEVWGVILADTTKNRKDFNEENLIFLNFLSNLFSLSLDRISTVEKLQDEKERLINELQSTEKLPDMVGESIAMREVARIIHKVARTDATVLITGESGVGKDLAARAIHKLSERKKGPYLAQFCGSIPDSLLESELFGYRKGAFTGAAKDKKGLLEVANKGTFFLDEIADITTALQAKLLRVIENMEIIRLGDTKPKKIDVRIIAATNKDLQTLVQEKKFREDLFYRLNVFPVRIPPLRERVNDIPMLADYFIKQHSKEKKALSKSAVKKMLNYEWPGNVRQLLNVIQRAIILSDDEKIEAENIIIDDNSETGSEGTIKEIEHEVLRKRLEKFDYNKTLAAQSLGVSTRWIQLKLKEMDIE
jgi:Nif-specific regulatory protein